VAHQWWAAGGRIRFRRSTDGDSTRVVGLQYIAPMDHWFGGNDSPDAQQQHDRLTYQQIMSLPEIRYSKPQLATKNKLGRNATSETIFENENDDAPGSNNYLFNNDKNADDSSDDGMRDVSTEVSGIVDATPVVDSTTIVTNGTDEGGPIEGGMETDGSFSEGSFENEPSTTRLQLPTSPERVPSTATMEALSPRVVVAPKEEVDEAIHKEELPPDEERPEDQHQQEPQQPQEPLSTGMSAAPTSPTQQQQQPGQRPDIDSTHLSMRTQRRIGHFTNTSCTACSICIEDFEEGETLRLLPRCGHAFHLDCILPWLQDRQGCCPLCKTGVLDDGSDNGNNADGNDPNNNNNSNNSTNNTNGESTNDQG